jgi:holo-[acyl-carrier protein] synthase
MIAGIGTDIVQINRLEKSIQKFGNKFAKHILSEIEMVEWLAMNKKKIPQQARFLAKRFAAKEACAKAFGTGFRKGLSMTHIGIVHDPLGKPAFVFLQVAERIFIQQKIHKAFLSLSDEKDYCTAMVILETKER